jgi:Pyrimidine dimer DNA glycosylase
LNTFLPYPNYQNSAKCLDSNPQGNRLLKQGVETLQIINTLLGKSEGWKNHPAVLQWAGCVDSLCLYGQAIANELKSRKFGGADSLFLKFSSLKSNSTQIQHPAWLGLEIFHSSHRAKLLYKGRVDSVCYAIKSHYKLRSINVWLAENKFSQKNMLTPQETGNLEIFCNKYLIDIPPNHYKQFNWRESDDGLTSYVWPSKLSLEATLGVRL